MPNNSNIASGIVDAMMMYLEEYPKHANNDITRKTKETLEESMDDMNLLNFVRRICVINNLRYRASVNVSRLDGVYRGKTGVIFSIRLMFSPLDYGTLHEFMDSFYVDTVGFEKSRPILKNIVSESIQLEYRNNDDVPLDKVHVSVVNYDPNKELDKESLDECYERMRGVLRDYTYNKPKFLPLFKDINFEDIRGATRVVMDFSLIVPASEDITKVLVESVVPTTTA